MNNRNRQKHRALRQEKYPPVMATLKESEHWARVIFIDPRELEECKKLYGERLKVLF